MKELKRNVFTYYDIGPLLSKNATINIAVGGRGNGKTFSAKKWCINDYINNGFQFVWLRRYKTELKTTKTFFDDIVAANLFPEYEFRVVGPEAQIRKNTADDKEKWKIIGWFRALSNAVTQKSTSYHNVTKIIYDEFILEPGPLRYLTDEVDTFLGFYSTVDRWQDKTRVLMLANNVSIMNPYFIEWGIEPKGQQWVKSGNGFIQTQFIESREFEAQVYQTKFGQFIQGTTFGDYAIEAEFRDNSLELIRTKPSRAMYYATIETRTGIFSVWIDLQDKEMGGPVFYVQDKRPLVEDLYTLLPENMTENKKLLDYSDRIISMMRTAFKTARVFFINSQARNSFAGIFRK